MTKKTPLYDLHVQAGGRMIDFAGWSMPVQYESALREHLAVRQQAGVFDVSHMGEIELTGPDALELAQEVTCNDVSRLVDGQAQYSALLTPEGTFVDDVVVYRLAADHILLCVNAATTDKDHRWIAGRQTGDVEVGNRSDSYAQLAIQGPLAQRILQPLTDVDLGGLKFYRFGTGSVSGEPAIVSRTGYTGEPGFEVYLPPGAAPRFWRELFEEGAPQGLKPAGLAARNTLRLEMRYPLYGNDIGEDVTPLEAGLAWIVKLEKGPFVGRDALLELKKNGVQRSLAGFELIDAGIARDGDAVYVDGARSGPVTSGSYSPSLKKSIGLAYLPPDAAGVGAGLEVEVRGRRRQGQVVETPFYRPPK